MTAKTALVVEDDDTIREALAITLEAEGFSVEAVATLAAARESLGRRPPAIVVLDLMLPDGRADELLAELAQTSDAPPTVLVSASPDAADVANRYGIACMAKPFDLDHLIELLQAAIAKRRSPSGPPPSH